MADLDTTLGILPAPDYTGSAFHDLDAFVAYLRVERCASEHTVASYKLDIRRLLAFLEQRRRDAVSADRDDIHAYVISLQDAGLAGNSIARDFQAARSFYKFLRYSGSIRKDPTRGIRAPRFRMPLVESIPDGEVQKLLTHLGKKPKFERPDRCAMRLRDLAMVRTFYDSGLRVSELIGLRLVDVNFGAGAMRVTGKGGKQRNVPISPPQADALKAYLAHARARLIGRRPERGYLFISSTRGGHGWAPSLSRQAVFLQIRDLGLSVLGRSIHPHQLRHSFGSTLVSHGADPRYVQALLGHKDIDTTMRYVHVQMSTIITVHAKTHPRG